METGFKLVSAYQGQDDLDKDKYCKEHGIKLVRIPYTVNKIKDIKKILSYYINYRA